MTSRTPPVTPSRFQPAKENETENMNNKVKVISEAERNDELAEIIYPSAKLGAITRKRNQMKRIMESNEYENVEILQNLQREFRQKIDNFSTAVKEEMAKVNLQKEDIDEFRSWVDSHLETNIKFDKEFHQYLY